MSAARLVARNAAQFAFCFAGSALLNVRSQTVFTRAVPGQKAAWLAATLLVGTVASVAGVRVAQHRKGLGATEGLALAAVATALFGYTLAARDAVAFAVACAALRFALQYGTQSFDRAAVLLAGVAERRANDLVGLAMRFGGMLAGPLWLGLAGEPGPLTAALVVALGIASAGSARSLAGAPAQPGDTTATGGDRSPGDRALLAAARWIYGSFYLLASSAVFVLADLHHIADATRRGGILITTVYASAVLATAVEMARGARRRDVRAMLAAPAAMALAGALLGTRLAAGQAAQLVGGALLGAAFARFLLAFRDHATHTALHRNRPALLADYNNLANTSALLGYGAMAALAVGTRIAHFAYAAAVGPAVALMGLVAAPLVLLGARRIANESHA